MFPMFLEMADLMTSTLAAVEPETGFLPELSNQFTFFMMVGLFVLFSLLSGIPIYYSPNFPHAQHGHDDH